MAKKRKIKKSAFLKLFLFIIFVTLIAFGGYKIYKKLSASKYSEYTKTVNLLDSKVDITVYSKYKDDGEKILGEIEKIYNKYNMLLDRDNSYENVNNLYSINHASSISKMTIDKELYDFIQFGLDCNKNSYELININNGNLIDFWKEYIQNKSVPSIENLASVINMDIKNVILYPDNQILVGNINLDLSKLAQGYVANVVKHYLDSVNFKNYIIKSDSVLLVGEHIENDKFNLSLINSDDPALDAAKNVKINASNKIVVSTYIKNHYEVNGANYNDYLNYRTLSPVNNMKSVTVIANDYLFATQLSNALFLVSIEDGSEYVKNFQDVEVLWVSNDNQITKTPGFSKYE